MSAFQDQLAADLDVFLSTSEFGAWREVDGYEIECVREEEELAGHPADGVYRRTSLLHVRADDLPTNPQVGQRMSVEGELATVIHRGEAEGMLSLRLEWLES